MKTRTIKEMDVVEVRDDTQLYFVVKACGGIITVKDIHNDLHDLDKSNVINVWRPIN
tara:strand:+ start:656 stop:826 length:171 start_codon:yes stop_codon:yes gene_type:complete